MAIKWAQTKSDDRFQYLVFETPTGEVTKKVRWSAVESGKYQAGEGKPFFVLFVRFERDTGLQPWQVGWMGNDKKHIEGLAETWVKQKKQAGRSKVVEADIVQVELMNRRPPPEIRPA